MAAERWIRPVLRRPEVALVLIWDGVEPCTGLDCPGLKLLDYTGQV